MIQIQLIQVEMSTSMRGDLHALLTFPQHSISPLRMSLEFELGKEQRSSGDSSIGERRHPLLIPVLLQAGTHG